MLRNTHPEIIARMGEIMAELDRLDKFDTLSRSQQLRWDAAREEFYELDEQRKQLERSIDRGRLMEAVRSGAGGVRTEAGTPPDRSRPGSDDDGPDPFNPHAGSRDQAMRILESEVRSERIPAQGAERVEAAFGTGPLHERTLTQRWVTATGDPAYARAFFKLAADPVNGHRTFTDEELRAFQAAERVNAELRAMAVGTGPAGGFLVPFVLDPTVIITNAGVQDPLRRIARQETTAGTSWNGVTSLGATAEWKAEAAQAADGSPVLAQPSIPVYLQDVFLPVSIEASMDMADAVEAIGAIIADESARHEALAFWKGTGSTQPRGLVTALNAVPGSKVATTTADVLVLGDVVKPQNALPPRWQGRAQWCANLNVINQVGSFETAAGARRYPSVDEGRLLNRDLNEASQLDNPGATATAGNDFVIAYGDFTQFIIVDRIGLTVEFVPHLFGAAGRPTGQRGWFGYRRVGSDVVVADAFRVLTA